MAKYHSRDDVITFGEIDDHITDVLQEGGVLDAGKALDEAYNRIEELEDDCRRLWDAIENLQDMLRDGAA